MLFGHFLPVWVYTCSGLTWGISCPALERGPCSLFFICSFFFNVYFILEREKEKKRMSRGGAEREGDGESEAGSVLPAESLMQGSDSPAHEP